MSGQETGKYDLIVVTGASQGIGRAVASAVAPLTRRLVVCARSKSLDKLALSLSGQETRCDAIGIDLTDFCAVQARMESVFAVGEVKTVAFIFAGGTLGEPGGVLSSDPSEWVRCYSTNLVGHVALLRAAAAIIRSAAKLRVLFFAGGGAAYQYPLFQPYAASKVATVRSAENFAEEIRACNSGDACVIALAPGAVDTSMLKSVRAAGGEVRTTVDISEPVNFVRRFLETNDLQALSGRFLHVRDDIWGDRSKFATLNDLLKLRRIE